MAGHDREYAGPFLRARLRVDERYRLELEQARAYGKSHSVFTGRVVQPGEPEFLREDTDGAIALAEEERDTCGSCGLLKAICRDPAHQFNTFEAHDELCHATYALEAHRKAIEGDGASRAATRTYVRFKAGREPDLLAGLNLSDD